MRAASQFFAAQFAAQFSLTAILSAGAIASFLSDSVLQGFTSAAAVLISTSQLKLVTIYINRTTKARADQLDLQQHD